MFDYLNPRTAKDVLVQALLAAPMFGTRWRWNVTRALLLPRTQHGGRISNRGDMRPIPSPSQDDDGAGNCLHQRTGEDHDKSVAESSASL